jgi:hypothetical protein
MDGDYSWRKVYRSFKDTVYTAPPPHNKQRPNSKSLIGGVKVDFHSIIIIIIIIIGTVP